MGLYNPFSKKDRKNKKKAQTLTRLCEQKSILLCSQYQHSILNSSTMGVGNNEDDEIIVSLTSFRARLDIVAYTIESLMQQTIKADRIILSLGGEDIRAHDIPESLKKLEKRGLEIQIYDEDLGPYKKYYYTLKDNPESLIITTDDDTLYPFDMIEKLYRAYSKNGDVIHCHRGHEMTIKNGMILPYKKWTYSSQLEKASLRIFPTGVGGVLYFPGSLHSDALDKETFINLCPNADDIWLKAMSLRNNTACKTIKSNAPFNSNFLTIPFSQIISLKRTNKKREGNNEKIQQVFNKYLLSEKL